MKLCFSPYYSNSPCVYTLDGLTVLFHQEIWYGIDTILWDIEQQVTAIGSARQDGVLPRFPT